MVMDAFILFLYNIIVPSEYYKKKTQYIMAGTLVAAVINIITNYIFIKMFGFVAAAYTTLFSYVCYLVLHIIISKKLVKFDIVTWKWIIISAIIVATTGAIDIYFVENLIVRYSICAVLVAVMCPPLVKYYLTNKRSVTLRS